MRETCEIALARLAWAKREATPPSALPFTSIDPAPPLLQATDIASLAATLTNPALPLFDRYRAMFSLRNIAGARHPATEKAAVEALAGGFVDDSELFK